MLLIINTIIRISKYLNNLDFNILTKEGIHCLINANWDRLINLFFSSCVNYQIQIESKTRDVNTSQELNVHILDLYCSVRV